MTVASLESLVAVIASFRICIRPNVQEKEPRHALRCEEGGGKKGRECIEQHISGQERERMH